MPIHPSAFFIYLQSYYFLSIQLLFLFLHTTSLFPLLLSSFIHYPPSFTHHTHSTTTTIPIISSIIYPTEIINQTWVTSIERLSCSHNIQSVDCSLQVCHIVLSLFVWHVSQSVRKGGVPGGLFYFYLFFHFLELLFLLLIIIFFKVF